MRIFRRSGKIWSPFRWQLSSFAEVVYKSCFSALSITGRTGSADSDDSNFFCFAICKGVGNVIGYIGLYPLASDGCGFFSSRAAPV